MLGSFLQYYSHALEPVTIDAVSTHILVKNKMLLLFYSDHNLFFRDLSFNKLTGQIPNTLGGLKNNNML